MMRSFLARSALFICLALMISAGRGGAATLNILDNGFPEGVGGVSLNSSTTGGVTQAQLTFTWQETAFSSFVELETDFDFDLFFVDYVGAAEGDVSGFVLEALSADDRMRLTRDSDLCLAAASPLSGTCTLIAGDGFEGAALRPSVDDVLFSLSAGRYLFGLHEDADPQVGSARFALSEVAQSEGGTSAVPLSGALLFQISIICLLFAPRVVILGFRRKPDPQESPSF